MHHAVSALTSEVVVSLISAVHSTAVLACTVRFNVEQTPGISVAYGSVYPAPFSRVAYNTKNTLSLLLCACC